MSERMRTKDLLLDYDKIIIPLIPCQKILQLFILGKIFLYLFFQINYIN